MAFYAQEMIWLHLDILFRSIDVKLYSLTRPIDQEAAERKLPHNKHDDFTGHTHLDWP